MPTLAPAPTLTATPPVTAVTRTPVATFSNPWAMTFLPDGRLLVTEKPGRLFLVTTGGAKTQVAGVPTVVSSGQIGLHDVIVAPDFANSGRIYLSYMEAASGGERLAVARATLGGGAAPALSNLQVIWRGTPATTGGHPGARLAISPDRFLFVSSGDRQQGSPAQHLGGTLGKVLRLNLDGSVPAGNPFAGTPGARAEIWSLGHRNPYGLTFAGDGRLFELEHGPEGGDEFNLIAAGRNYGWPLVSEGSNYGGAAIPRHSTRPDLAAPLVSWTPVIAPGNMIQYRGTLFTGWTGDFVLAGLVSQGLVRVRVSGTTASEVGRVPLQARIREVEEGPDGALWVLEDGGSGRLVRLDPAFTL
jgi:aldose sugar dehydrogenase